MKRKLVDVRDVDGLITANTTPWRSIDEFEQARDLLDDWKQSQRRVLKTKQDYDDMTEWGRLRANRRQDRHPRQTTSCRRRPWRCSRSWRIATTVSANGFRP